MFCHECGTKNRDFASFCINCGEKLYYKDRMKKDSPPKLKSGSPELEPGFLLEGRYRIIQKLASGGMGKLFLADDTRMNFPVVIKQMIHLGITGEKLKYLEKRFLIEARLLFQLKHRSLPRVVDYFNKENASYIIMEYVKGKNFSQLLADKPGGRLSLSESYYLMLQSLDILIYLHNQSPPVIHRDIKPGNLMLNSDGGVMLVDFGLAKAIEEGKKGTARVGTYGFVSPEHQSGKFSVSSDLYSLGATFHYLLSGENPRNRLPFTFPPFEKYNCDVPKELQKIFNRLLSLKKEDRYQKAEDVKKDLMKIENKSLSGKDKIENSDLLFRQTSPPSKQELNKEEEPSTVIGNTPTWTEEETVVE